jgi:hypothetical protein
VGNCVGNGEDGGNGGNDRGGGNCVSQDRGGGGSMGKDGVGSGNTVCQDGGGGSSNWKGEGDGVCGVGQKNGGVGFRPGQAERGNGENSKLRGF